MADNHPERQERKREIKPLTINRKDFARKTIDGVIDEYCGVVNVSKPVVIYSESVFATHKANVHHENRDEVLKDIRESNSGKNRALTCDRCFGIILMRPKNLGMLEDSKHTVKPITTLRENIRFLLLHELMHVKLRDSEYKNFGTYHTRNLLLQFNRYAGKLGVTKYKE